MYCTNCGEQMNENQAICLKCGVKTGAGNNFCFNCGNAVNPKAVVCTNCGVALRGGNGGTGDLNGQDKITMALICFFFGFIGIHNFMMGEKKKGIMKIVLTLCCGISTIFALIDFIKILTDKYVYDPEKLI